MSVLGLEKAAALLALVAGSQAWARWRAAVRERAASNAPLFDAVALEAALASQISAENVEALDDLRDLLRQHNRIGDASALPADIAALYARAAPQDQAALLRALRRLADATTPGLERLGEPASCALALLSHVSHTPLDIGR